LRQESKKVIKDETVTVKAFFYGNKVDRGFVLDEEQTVILSEEDTISIKAFDIMKVDDVPQPEDNSAPTVAVADPLSFWIQVELFEHGKYFFICIQRKRFSR
jgi:hypothetical protein